MTPRTLFAFTFAASLVSIPALAQDDPESAQDQAPLSPLPPSGSTPAPSPLPPDTAVPLLPVPPRSAPPLASPRSVWIHIDSGRVVMLQHLAPFDTVWTETCFSPCDGFAPLDGTYRVVAPAIVSSREVELEAQPGDKVVLDIHARTLAQRRTAETLSLASYVAGGVGLALEIGALTVNSKTAQTALFAAGVGAAVTGLTFVITSLVLGQPTGVSQSTFRPVSGSAPVASAPVQPDARGMGASTHQEGAHGPLLPEATSAPLLTLTF